jgi:hypothetical protein
MSAAPDNLFVVNEDCNKLSNEAAAAFHTIVAKSLYITKRARPDISLAIAFLRELDLPILRIGRSYVT